VTAAAKDQTTAVRYVLGDATRPEGDGLKIIAHCCNNLGGWGAGFVVALSRRWERPEREYRQWAERSGETKFQGMLGAMQLVPVEDDIFVANIIGQNGMGRAPDGGPPIRYAALSKGFGFISDYALRSDRLVSVHMPRIGCGLAGGDWSEIEPLLDEHFVLRDIPVTVYDLA
jgi:O-acetyl-ADP-ribose deacetylase (regulator of RNase III)